MRLLKEIDKKMGYALKERDGQWKDQWLELKWLHITKKNTLR